MRVRVLFSAACLVLLLGNATDELLLSRDPELISESYQLRSSYEHQLSHQFNVRNHKNVHYYLLSRYLNKPAERQTQLAYCLLASDTLSALEFHALSLDSVDQRTVSRYRVKQHHESNLIYRFIHSRNYALVS